MGWVEVKVLLKNFIKKVANAAGLDVRRLVKNPMHTLLGLRDLPIKTVIDVGANRGQFAAYVSTFYPGARLVCFEPLPGPFQKLQQWASGQANVTTFNLALGEEEGTATMFHHLDHSTSSSLLATTELSKTLYPFTERQRTVVVPMSTLDRVFEKMPELLQPDILIKLDVQGYEEHVIAGGKRTFAAASACIVEVSLDELYKGQADFKRLMFMLDDLGFRYVGNLEQNVGEDGHVIFFDAVFAR